eukprot:97866_1
MIGKTLKSIIPNSIYNYSSLLVIKNSPSAFSKITSYGADCNILDLEDSVPIEKKLSQRQHITNILDSNLGMNIGIRVNNVWYCDIYNELSSVIHPNTAMLCLPKIQTTNDVQFYNNMITQVEKEKNMQINKTKLHIIIEEPSAVSNINEILNCCERNISVSLGSGDYGSSVGCDVNKTDSLLFVRSSIVNAAKSNNLYCFDGPYLKIYDINGFIKHCEYAKSLGFSGVICVHPNQVNIANNIFGLNETDLRNYETQLNYHNNIENNGGGTTCDLGDDNSMIGPPHLRNIEKVINAKPIKEINEEYEVITLQLTKPHYVPISCAHFEIGYKFRSITEITVNEYWIHFWNSLFYSSSRLYNNICAMKSKQFELIFKDFIIPGL